MNVLRITIMRKMTKCIRFPQYNLESLQNIDNVDFLISFAEFCVLKYIIQYFSIIHI